MSHESCHTERIHTMCVCLPTNNDNIIYKILFDAYEPKRTDGRVHKSWKRCTTLAGYIKMIGVE